MMNLYLSKEKAEQNQLSRSVFNLNEKPQFSSQMSDQVKASNNFDRSVLNLYLKSE